MIWSQNFCKFSALSLEFQNLLSITRTFFFSQLIRTILVIRYDFIWLIQNWYSTTKFILTYSNPLVFDDIVNAESLMGISFQHSSKGPFIHYVSTCREGSGLVQKMAIFAYCQYINHANKYLVSGWVKKCPKTYLRHIWMVPNEIFCIFGHIFPFWVGKLILTGPNALFHSGGNGQTVVTVEWWKTT